MKVVLKSALLVLLLARVVSAADSGTLLVLNKPDNTVSFIDLGLRKAVATIPTGVGPHEAYRQTVRLLYFPTTAVDHNPEARSQ